MTTDKTDPEFYIRISGITYEDAVTLCVPECPNAADDWCANEDADGNEGETGEISIPVANIDEAMRLFRQIEDAHGWTYARDWGVSLRATRITPTYNLTASLTGTGCTLLLMPVKPASTAVADALSRMQLAIADVQTAACLLEGQ
jgi:hypothetical protein